MTLTERVYRRLTKAKGRWVDGRELARVGGYAAYRTRLSECRRAPWNLTIENRWHDKIINKQRVRVSEYRAVT